MERRRQMRAQWGEKAQQCEWRGDLKMEEIKKHNTIDDCWIVIDNDVYDVTQYASNHPGGSSIFLKEDQKDISEVFHRFHRGMSLDWFEKLKIGRLIE